MIPRLIIGTATLLLLGSGLFACSDAHTNIPKTGAPYLAIARGKIDVDGGIVNIIAPQDIIFSEVNVAVGRQVKAGDLLGKLASAQATLNLELTDAEVRHSQDELAALKSRLNAAESLNRRWHLAASAGAAEQQQADDASQALAQLRSEITAAKSLETIARIKQQQAQLELTQQSLRAPVDAEVVKVYAQPGISLGANHSAAFTLLPNKPLLVRAEINEMFVAQIQPGTKAAIVLESSAQSAPLAAHVVRLGKLLEPSHWGEDLQPGRAVECILAFEQPQHLLVGQNLMVKFYE